MVAIATISGTPEEFGITVVLGSAVVSSTVVGTTGSITNGVVVSSGKVGSGVVDIRGSIASGEVLIGAVGAVVVVAIGSVAMDVVDNVVTGGTEVLGLPEVGIEEPLVEVVDTGMGGVEPGSSVVTLVFGLSRRGVP